MPMEHHQKTLQSGQNFLESDAPCSHKCGQVLATDMGIAIVIVIPLVSTNIFSLLSLVWLDLGGSPPSGHAGLLGFYPGTSEGKTDGQH